MNHSVFLKGLCFWLLDTSLCGFSLSLLAIPFLAPYSLLDLKYWKASVFGNSRDLVQVESPGLLLNHLRGSGLSPLRPCQITSQKAIKF
jgi:hypothetical protein